MRVLLDTCVWGKAKADLSRAGHDTEWTGDWGDDRLVVIVTDYSDVEDISQDLVDEGYGFCVLSAPPLFQDWGWSDQEGG